MLSDMLNSEALRCIRRNHLGGDLSELPLCLYCGNRSAVNMGTIIDELRTHLNAPLPQGAFGAIAAE